jgi:eukaryotic-like serine/threonine-protein kinase
MTQIAPQQRLAGRYVVEEHIADGGMASVWRARDEVLARSVAVKTLRDERAGRADFRERFHREAVSAARLNHPAIISIFDTGVDDGVVFIVMEYFEGTTLAEVMQAHSPMDAPTAIRVMLPVLDALSYAHENGIVHRDVKPGNILVNEAGRVKVADFGLAKAVTGEDLTTTGKVLGTVRYLSPEQVRSDAIDARSDIYSAGVVLYELVTGRPPFQAENDIATAMMRLTVDPVPPRSIVPGLPRTVEAAILRALARSPDDRFPTAESMRGALERWGAAEAPGAATATASVAEPDERRGRASTFRSWMLVPLLLVAVAAAIVVAGIALGRFELGGPFVIKGSQSEESPAPASIRIVRAQDSDPFGQDQAENPDRVGLAIDGNRDTFWSTEHYNSAAFGGLKQGLGLFFDLGGAREVTRVTISSPQAGWQFELLPGSAPDAQARPVSAADGTTRFTMPATGRLEIDLRPVRIPGLMIWISQLAPDPNGNRFVAEIGEVVVSGTRG